MRLGSLKAHLHDRFPSPAIGNFASVVSPAQFRPQFEGNIETEDGEEGISENVMLGSEEGSIEVILDGENVSFAFMLGVILGIALCSDEGLDVFGCGA